MKDDGVYLKHVLRCIARIEEYTAAGRESFFSSIWPRSRDGAWALAVIFRRLPESWRVVHDHSSSKSG